MDNLFGSTVCMSDSGLLDLHCRLGHPSMRNLQELKLELSFAEAKPYSTIYLRRLEGSKSSPSLVHSDICWHKFF